MEDYWNIMEYGWSMIGDTLWQSKVAEWHIRELNGGLNGNFMELNGQFQPNSWISKHTQNTFDVLLCLTIVLNIMFCKKHVQTVLNFHSTFVSGQLPPRGTLSIFDYQRATQKKIGNQNQT